MVDRNRAERRWFIKTIGFAAWTAIVSLFLLWEATSYTGIMSLIGEWQFNTIGRQYPTFNFTTLIFLLLLPGYLLFRRPRGVSVNESTESALFRSARAMLRAVISAAVVFGVGALIILAALLLLPGNTGTRQIIDLSKPVPGTLAEGPVTLYGQAIFERTAGFDQDMLLAKRSFRFAPVIAPRDDHASLRFFLQLPPEREGGGASAKLAAPYSGVLKRNGLPGEVIRLFRYAGYEVEQPDYVLFTEPPAMRWPYLALLVQFVIGAFIALILAGVQWRRFRHIDHERRRPVEAALT